MNIKLFIVDLDGTLTNGLYHVSEKNGVSKSFYTRDFSAMEKLYNKNIIIMIITNSTDSVIYEKIKNINYCIYLSSGIKNKVEEIERFFFNHEGFGWENVAYIGDAENDIECVEKALFSCCPNDAIPEIKEKVDFVSTYNGGNDAVWEFVKEILKMKEIKNEEDSQG